jgi:hypothetical protein
MSKKFDIDVDVDVDNAFFLSGGRIVFCCDEGFDFKAMNRIFVGLCQCGAWGCFDEFNRLEERILSAVSQQIQVIQVALKEKASEVDLIDKKVQINPDMVKNCSVFISLLYCILAITCLENAQLSRHYLVYF